jgi:hypothetical protein
VIHVDKASNAEDRTLEERCYYRDCTHGSEFSQSSLHYYTDPGHSPYDFKHVGRQSNCH